MDRGGRIIAGTMTVGALGAFQGLLAGFAGPAAQLVGLAAQIQDARATLALLDDTVRGLSAAGDTEVWEPLRAAAMTDVAAAMPMRLRTVLTDGSRTLSGGQVQRLLIARTLLQRPAALLLDEATSALDTATEAAVLRALAQLPATRLVIAHRLSTIRQADRVLYLEGGRVAESGTSEQLAAAGGFAQLVAAG